MNDKERYNRILDGILPEYEGGWCEQAEKELKEIFKSHNLKVMIDPGNGFGERPHVKIEYKGKIIVDAYYLRLDMWTGDDVAPEGSQEVKHQEMREEIE